MLARIFVGVVVLGALVAPPALRPASAQSNPVASVALYAGADRQQKLVEGAKKEGTLTYYTSAPVADIAALAGPFEKKYGIKVKYWRAASEQLLQRAVAEGRAHHAEVDVFETNSPEMEALHREGLLQKAASPHLADLSPLALRPHQEWVGTRFNIFSAAYNTNLVKKEELPKTYEDLLDPRWKGRLTIEADDVDWFGTTIKAMGEEKGLALFRRIVATNGISTRKGHTLLTNLVVSGEVALALTAYQYKPEQLKRKGAPIDWLVLPPAIARLQGLGVSRFAPHPYAAMLFYDFMLSDAQDIYKKRDFSPAKKSIKSLATTIPVHLVDPVTVLDESDKWSKLYHEIFLNQPR